MPLRLLAGVLLYVAPPLLDGPGRHEDELGI